MRNNFHCMLYRSQLAPNAASNSIPDIIRTARSFNAIHGVTGILVFDGRNFLQNLEGPERVVKELIGRIERDRRHVNFLLQYQGRGFGNRRFSGWSMAYAYIENDKTLQAGCQLQGKHAMMHFAELLPTLEIA